MNGLKNYHVTISLVIGLLLLVAPIGRAEETQASAIDQKASPPASVRPDPCGTTSTPSVELLPLGPPEAPQKKIIISIADQKMWVFENDKIVEKFPVSTGRPGHPTPTGRYSVHNRAPRAYSKLYDCYMLQWMALTGDGMIGMHALEGRSYERLLGHVASHGCIRLSHQNANWLYEWVEPGMPVDIVADWDEPPEPVKEDEVLEDYPFHW